MDCPLWLYGVANDGSCTAVTDHCLPTGLQCLPRRPLAALSPSARPPPPTANVCRRWPVRADDGAPRPLCQPTAAVQVPPGPCISSLQQASGTCSTRRKYTCALYLARIPCTLPVPRCIPRCIGSNVWPTRAASRFPPAPSLSSPSLPLPCTASFASIPASVLWALPAFPFPSPSPSLSGALSLLLSAILSLSIPLRLSLSSILVPPSLSPAPSQQPLVRHHPPSPNARSN